MILKGEKRLLQKSAVKFVDVGNFPEVSVKGLYTEFSERPDIKPYMPPKINKGRQCDKDYFWNVINTLCEEEVEAIVQHAHNQRKSVDEGDM